jgi:Integral peroxisomal membrane peroxin
MATIPKEPNQSSSPPSSKNHSRAASIVKNDFDHEINLEDHTHPANRTRDSEDSASPTSSGTATPVDLSRANSGQALSRKWTLREQLARRKYSKYQEHHYEKRDSKRRNGQPVSSNASEDESDDIDPLENVPGAGPRHGNGTASATSDTSEGIPTGEHGKHSARVSISKATRKDAKEAPDEIFEVDVLYENQRGMFWCGLPLFSHNSLLNLDPSPWQTSTFKDSAVSIMDAQVPDPSWEWAWKSWYVDMSADVDEEGWAYSLSFNPYFSWHGTHVWFHAFVRRRRWVRRRIKRHPHRMPASRAADKAVREAHMLTAEYFTIHPENSRRSTMTGQTGQGRSADDEVVTPLEDIDNVPALMKALKHARIDRERIEALQSFLDHGGEELAYLPSRVITP